MNTITTDEELAIWCEQLANTSDAANAWIERNSEIVRNEKNGLEKDLRRASRLFKNCARAARRKMCAGVFGPSQAGKSYLISALARGESLQLDAVFAGKSYDFLSEINPEGGKESTGLVTRFTMTKYDAPKDYPVKLALLSEMDLVKIIANTYYADCEHKETPQSNISAKLEKLRALAKGANEHVDRDNMEDLREYLTGEFRSKARIQELERLYWDEAIELAPKLNLLDRIELYALIWDDVEEFTQLLRRLLTALQELDYPEILFCSLDALLPREKSIIDVATLAQLENAENGETIAVQPPAGKPLAIPRAIITALTAELTIYMAEKPADYFEHTDLLDFPGYRSRYKLDNIRKELKKEGMLKELFLRGKVAYLFQRYCAEKELTSMLLCIGPSNQEVQDLPGVINAWIASTHGPTPAEREGKAVSLFFILTKFDMEFEDKKGAPSLESRWDNRLHASLIDFFGKQHDWPTQWTPHKGFNNIFLLRNPNFRFEAIMDFNGDQETGIRKNREEYVSRLKKAFLDSSLVKEHFQDPELAWNEAMKLNDGGISHIRKSLSPLCDPAIKRNQLLQNVNACRENLVRRLSGFYQTDDKEELRNQKTRLIVTLFKSLGKLEMQRQRLGQLLRAFTISDQDLYNLHAAALRNFRNQTDAPAIETESAPEDIDLTNLDLGSLNPFDDNNQPDAVQSPSLQDEADAYATVIESKWVENLHSLADNPAWQDFYMLTPQQFSSLASELALGVERLGFRKLMTEEFRKAAAYANTGQNTIARRQAAIAANILNNYINWLGHHPHQESDAERTIALPGGKNPKVFTPPQELEGLPVLGEQRNPYTQKWFQDWLNALAGLILDNVNFDGKNTFNRQENSALHAILQKFAPAA